MTRRVLLTIAKYLPFVLLGGVTRHMGYTAGESLLISAAAALLIDGYYRVRVSLEVGDLIKGLRDVRGGRVAPVSEVRDRLRAERAGGQQ